MAESKIMYIVTNLLKHTHTFEYRRLKSVVHFVVVLRIFLRTPHTLAVFRAYQTGTCFLNSDCEYSRTVQIQNKRALPKKKGNCTLNVTCTLTLLHILKFYCLAFITTKC